ncbi:MAG: hypothetical protein ACREAA_15315 [Candidatus Polarisedimenticolia bacterium]
MKTMMTFCIMALLLLQATGLDVAVAPIDCQEGCPTDGPDGACAPLCPDCVCCPVLRSCIQPESPKVPCATTQAPRAAEECNFPADAEPAEIFHVPRSPLA